MKITSTILAILMTGCLLITTAAQTTSHSENLKPYLTDDVAAVIYFDLNRIDGPGLVQAIAELGLLNEDELSDMKAAAEKFAGEIQKLRSASVDSIYGLIRMEDLVAYGPNWVVPVKNSKNLQTATERLKALEQFFDVDLIEFWGDDGNAVLAGGNPDWIEQIKTNPANGNRELAAGWQAMGNGGIGLLVMGDADSRNVARFMFPPLPEPFQNITGKMVADQLQWAGLEINIAKNWGINVVIETDDPQTAQQLQQAATAGISLFLENIPQSEDIPAAFKQEVTQLLQPTVIDNRIAIVLDSSKPETQRLVEVFRPAVDEVRMAAAKTTEMNKLRQMVLAILNFEAAFQRFPISHQGDTRMSNLSWRVHILPYVGENELYNQFKLDEPWDSPHNRQLIDKMPDLYHSQYSDYRAVNQQGKTAFLIPHAKGAMSDPELTEPRKFSQILDGSSNTILLVTVAPQHAQVWTQPADWELDYANPSEKLQVAGRDFSLVALVDGSVQTLPAKIHAKTLSALVTIAGGEVVSPTE